MNCILIAGLVALSGCSKAFIDLSETTSMTLTSDTATTTVAVSPPPTVLSPPPIPKTLPKRCIYHPIQFPPTPAVPVYDDKDDNLVDIQLTYIEKLLRRDREVRRQYLDSVKRYYRCR